MARVYEYKRSVDAVTTEGDFGNSQLKLGSISSISIKQEPCNTSGEDTCTTDNGENTEYVLNNMPENDKTVCGQTTEISKDNMPDDISKNTCNNENTICRPTEKKKSRKRKRHERCSLGDKSDCENIKALQESEINLRSSKKLKQTVTAKRKYKIVYCKVCSSKFYSYFALTQHKKSYDKRKQKFLIGDISYGVGKYCCNFCPQMYKMKKPLKAHLFHFHQSELGIDIDEDSSFNEPSNSHSHTPKKAIMRQTTLLEYMLPPTKSECSELSNLNDSNAYSHAIIKQEIDLNDNDADLSVNMLSADTSLHNEILSQTMRPNQPFVKIHVHSTTMKVLLGIDSNDSLESSEHNNIYNNTDMLYSVGSSSNSKKLNDKEFKVSQTKPVNIDEQLKNKDLLSKCKKCSVTLVRCDDKLITKSTSQFNTPSTPILRQNNNTSLKRKRRTKDRNAKITPTLDTSKNAISKDSNSTYSTPKGILSTSTPVSTISTHDFHKINNLNKYFANRRSSLEQITPIVKEKIFSEKTNDLNPKDSSLQEKSPQEKSIRTNIPNKPTVDLKLKELKVILVKLPKIKKEFDTTNICYCDVCELPFTSERRRDKHIRKFHTTYISSICTARRNSKRHMLKHYLQEHCIWGCNRCCVCRKFFRSRLLLRQHLLLHCIKVILSKDDKCLNTMTKCNVMSKMRNRTNSLRPFSIKRKEIADIGQENVNANSATNVESQVDERKINNEVGAKINYEQQAFQTNEISHEMQHTCEDNVIYLSANNDYDTTEQTKEPLLDPLNIVNDSHINDNETRITLTPNLSTVGSSISSDKKSPSTISRIRANSKDKHPCSICGKQFQKLESLWKHKRTYTQSLQHFCTSCGLCVSNKKILRRHFNTTHDYYLCNLYKYHCQFCNQGFRSESNLRIHELHYHAVAETTNKQKVAELLQVSNIGKNATNHETMCTVCGRNFNSFDRYQLHCMYYHKGHVFACNFCDQIFQGLYMLHHHNKVQHYPESTKLSYTYHCPICYEGFTIETHFHGHMAHVHSNKHVASPNDVSTSPKKSYVCTKCHLEFLTIMELMIHVEHYTDGGNYKCKQCHRKCCTLAVLNEHINLSHGDSLKNNYKCDVCNEVLISSTSLLCHKKHIHQSLDSLENFTTASKTSDETAGETESNIHDKVLPVTVRSENELASPLDPSIRMNTPITPVKVWAKCNISCPICGVKFDTELYLKKHLIEYLDVGDYECKKCQRRFANYEILSKHMSNHTKPGMPLTKYHCTVCNESFQSSIVYESHVAHLHASIIVTDAMSSNV